MSSKRCTSGFLAIVLLAILVIGCSAQSASVNPDSDIAAIVQAYPQLADQPWTKAEVKRVVDGDTFETMEGDKVRLIGVNTPETVKPNSPVERYGKEASNYTKQALTGRMVYMFRDAGDKDTYSRLLRYVFLAGKTEMYNETLLVEGYANTMTVPPNVMFQKKFVELERRARENRIGLWADESASGPPPSCANPQVKGNINSRKEKIYHVPGGRSYAVTKAEQMFCTEAEATAAGFRKARD
ncbi:thermonuclease family protein [Paenibacillus koleovorans]|uniref:thermonuclease family protein n=1 Tax=Paenibacillus koleovorans TaxID=121608 RepID=UPI000FD7E796|nr:thermonuclease family protein [Paenibacillus koleovorans]